MSAALNTGIRWPPILTLVRGFVRFFMRQSVKHSAAAGYGSDCTNWSVLIRTMFTRRNLSRTDCSERGEWPRLRPLPSGGTRAVPPLLWRQAAKMWLGKGYTHSDASDLLEKKFGRRKGFGRSSIGLLATTKCEPCPQAVADFIIGLEVRDPERWAQYQREMENQPAEAPASPSLSSSWEAAKEAISGVADMIRAWLDSAGNSMQALASNASALLSGLAGKLDTLGDRLDGLSIKLDSISKKIDSNGAKLDTLRVNTNNTDSQVEVLGFKVDDSEARRRKDKWHILGAILGGFALLAFLQCQHAPSSALVGPALVQNVTVTQGTAQAAADATGSRGREWTQVMPYPSTPASNMGERKQEPKGPRMMPHEPLPGQALKPCPEATTTLYGACWIQTQQTAPCPSNQFQEGQSCYVPIQAANSPFSQNTHPSNPEQH